MTTLRFEITEGRPFAIASDRTAIGSIPVGDTYFWSESVTQEDIETIKRDRAFIVEGHRVDDVYDSIAARGIYHVIGMSDIQYAEKQDPETGEIDSRYIPLVYSG